MKFHVERPEIVEADMGSAWRAHLPQDIIILNAFRKRGDEETFARQPAAPPRLMSKLVPITTDITLTDDEGVRALLQRNDDHFRRVFGLQDAMETQHTVAVRTGSMRTPNLRQVLPGRLKRFGGAKPHADNPLQPRLLPGQNPAKIYLIGAGTIETPDGPVPATTRFYAGDFRGLFPLPPPKTLNNLVNVAANTVAIGVQTAGQEGWQPCEDQLVASTWATPHEHPPIGPDTPNWLLRDCVSLVPTK